MFDHHDSLSELNNAFPLDYKLRVIHKVLKSKYDFIDRISIALYDGKSQILKTFLASSGRDYPLEFYEARLDEAPSLRQMMATGKSRVINDLSVFAQGEHEHTKKILEQGYRASYTKPMFYNGSFWGFIFLNSYASECFDEQVLDDIDVYAYLITNIVGHEVRSVRAMLSALRTANELLATGNSQLLNSHLDRLARYARLIAQDLARSNKYDFTDADIENIFWFSPVHDITKRTSKSLELVNRMIKEYGFESFEGVDILRNIASCHQKEKAESNLVDVPIEARIAAVANIFDSMTSQLTSKQAWSNEEAFAMLRRLSKTEVDQDCVEALVRNADKIEQIQASFQIEAAYPS